MGHIASIKGIKKHGVDIEIGKSGIGYERAQKKQGMYVKFQ